MGTVCQAQSTLTKYAQPKGCLHNAVLSCAELFSAPWMQQPVIAATAVCWYMTFLNRNNRNNILSRSMTFSRPLPPHLCLSISTFSISMLPALPCSLILSSMHTPAVVRKLPGYLSPAPFVHMQTCRTNDVYSKTSFRDPCILCTCSACKRSRFAQQLFLVRQLTKHTRTLQRIDLQCGPPLEDNRNNPSCLHSQLPYLSSHSFYSVA